MDTSLERLRGTPLGNLDPITEVAEDAGVHSAAQSRAGSGHASRTASFNDLADAANGGRPPYARQNSGLKGLAGALKKASEGPTSAPSAALSGSGTDTGAGALEGAASEEESIAFEVVAPATADKPERRYSMVMKASKLSKLTMGRLKRNLSTSVGLPVESLLLCLMADPQSGLEDAWTAADLGITHGSVLHLLEREGLSGSAVPSTVQDLRSFLPPPPPPPPGTAHKNSKGSKKSNGLSSPGRGQGAAAELPSPSAPTALHAAPMTVSLGSSSGSTLTEGGLTGSGLVGGGGSGAQPSAFHATSSTASKQVSDLSHSAPSPILSDGPATSLSVLVSERERNSSGRNSPTKAGGTPSSVGSAGFHTANATSQHVAAPAALSRRAPSSNALPSVPLAAAVDALNTPLSVPPALAKRMRLRRIFSSLLATEESAFSYGSPPSGAGAFGGPSRSASSPGESRGFVSRAELAAAVSSDAEASSWPEYDPLIRSLLLGDQAVDGVTWSEASDLLQAIGEQLEKGGGGSSKSGSANRTSRAEVSSAFAPTSARKSENDSRASGEQLFLASPPRMVSSVALAVVSTGGPGVIQAEATSEESIMKPLHGVAQSVATPVPVPETAAKYAPRPQSQPLHGLASTLSPSSVSAGKRMPSAVKAYRDVVLEVEISDGRVLELPIRIGEEPFSLAAVFCAQYNLPIEDASNLADLIRPRLQQAYELELADARQAVADALTALDTANARIESAASTSSLKPAQPAPGAAGAIYTQAELDEAIARAVAQARTDGQNAGGVTPDGSLSTALADAAEATRQVASLAGEVETLRGERSVLQVEKNSLAGAVQELEEKLAELVNKLSSAELRASDSESRARVLEEESTSVAARHDMEKEIWRESMEGASQEVSRAHEMTTQVEKELASAQAQLKSAAEESSGLRAQIGSLLTDIARLNGTMQGLQEELRASEQREQAAVARGDAITQEHAAALSDLARMEKALESAAVRIAESESAISTAVTERDRALARAEVTEATMDRMRSDFAEAQKRKSAWEKYVDTSSYDSSSLSSSVAPSTAGGADQTTRAVMGNSTVGGASQAGNVSMADLGSSLSSVAGLSSSLRPSSAIAASMQQGDWRTWAAEKREILARANADRAALIEENKRLRQALGYGEADVEAKLRAQDEAVAALQGELLVMRSGLDRTEQELKTVYRQWEEDGRRWTQDRQRLLEELQAASVQLYGLGMQEGEFAFEGAAADPAAAALAMGAQ